MLSAFFPPLCFCFIFPFFPFPHWTERQTGAYTGLKTSCWIHNNTSCQSKCPRTGHFEDPQNHFKVIPGKTSRWIPVTHPRFHISSHAHSPDPRPPLSAEGGVKFGKPDSADSPFPQGLDNNSTSEQEKEAKDPDDTSAPFPAPPPRGCTYRQLQKTTVNLSHLSLFSVESESAEVRQNKVLRFSVCFKTCLCDSGETTDLLSTHTHSYNL